MNLWLKLIICAAVVLLFLVLAPDAWGFEVYVWGDAASTEVRTATPELHELMGRVSDDSTAIALGDYIYPSTSETLGTFFLRYESFLGAIGAHKRSTFFTPGNHELLDTINGMNAYAANIGDFNYSSAVIPRKKRRLLLVNLPTEGQGHNRYIGYYGEDDPRNSEEADWLVETLRANTMKLVFVYMHHPMFDPKETDPWATTRAHEPPLLDALFAKYGVDLVLAGHLHYYRRHVSPSGVTYVTVGPTGQTPRPEDFAPLDIYDVAHWGNYAINYLQIDVTLDGRARCLAWRYDGEWELGESFTVGGPVTLFAILYRDTALTRYVGPW